MVKIERNRSVFYEELDGLSNGGFGINNMTLITVAALLWEEENI